MFIYLVFYLLLFLKEITINILRNANFKVILSKQSFISTTDQRATLELDGLKLLTGTFVTKTEIIRKPMKKFNMYVSNTFGETQELKNTHRSHKLKKNLSF